MTMHEIEDRLHPFAASGIISKLRPGKSTDQVRFAIPAAEKVRQAIDRNVSYRRVRRICDVWFEMPVMAKRDKLRKRQVACSRLQPPHHVAGLIVPRFQ